MQQRYLNIGWIFCLVLVSYQAQAFRAFGGEITYDRVGELTLNVQIQTFQNPDVASERDSLRLGLDWVENRNWTTARSSTVVAPEHIRISTYEREIGLGGPSWFRLTLTDPNLAEFDNLPGSVNTVFALQTLALLHPSCRNNSARFLHPAYAQSRYGSALHYVPGAWDPDADSLAFSLIAPYGEFGVPLSGYAFPEGLTLDPATGELHWDFVQEGQWLVVMRVKEYRAGAFVGSVDRAILLRGLDLGADPPAFFSSGSWGNAEPLLLNPGELASASVGVLAAQGSELSWTIQGEGGLNADADAPVLQVFFSADTLKVEVLWAPEATRARRRPYLFTLRIRQEDSDGAFQSQDIALRIAVPGPDVEGCFPPPYLWLGEEDLGDPDLTVHAGGDQGPAVFPVPATDRIHLQWKQPGPYRVMLVNAAGQLLMQETVQGAVGVLERNRLPAGAYWVLWQSSTQAGSKPVVFR